MQLNEAGTKAKLIVSILILIVGIGTLLQFLEGHKIDHGPVKTYSFSISQGPTSNYAGTASNPSTTTTTL